MKDRIVVGLMFGDEGKGTTVDYLAREARPSSVVRFSGGVQAAHNVITEGDIHHTFNQFGAASLRGVPTTLTRHMMVNPLMLVEEGDALTALTGWNPFPDLMISEDALVTTPIHAWLNQTRENKRRDSLAEAHGSCGMGIGETRYYALQHPSKALRMKDIREGRHATIARKLAQLVNWAEAEVGESYNNPKFKTVPVSAITLMYKAIGDDDFLTILPDEQVMNRISQGYHIFEGSQGLLLDESYGFHPNTTWSNLMPEVAQSLLAEAGKDRGEVYGVTRSYLTRHGAGPFPTELHPVVSGVLFPELHNAHGEYQGGWRAGWFDSNLFDYATRVCQANGGLDHVVTTHMDVFAELTEPLAYVPLNGYAANLPTDFFNRDRVKQEGVNWELTQVAESENFILQDFRTAAQCDNLIESITGLIPAIHSYGPMTTQKTRKG